MPMVNPFDVFSVTEIAAAIDKVPNNFGRINQLGLFPARGVMSRSVAIEERNGSLALLPIEGGGSARGPGNVGEVGKRKLRTFQVPRLVHDEFCGPEEVQGVRMFGGSEQANLARLLNDKLATARAKHDITLEHLRMGALKGTILDADGSTHLNLYTEFGITPKEVDFVLGTAGTDVTDKCREVVDHIQDHLYGEIMTGVHALVSPEFFNKLIKHPKVEKFYLSYANSVTNGVLSGTQINMFPFSGIVFEVYRAISVQPSGSSLRFIAANSGHGFPLGTAGTFATHVAPADFNEAVGTLGQLYYAKTMPAKFDRGWDIHTQSNPLPLCHRPEVLVRCYTSN